MLSRPTTKTLLIGCALSALALLGCGDDSAHLCIEDASMADAAELDHNLYFQHDAPMTVRLGSGNYLHDVADLPAHAGQCLDAVPLLADPAGPDFHPTPSSPTIDSGTDIGGLLPARFGVTLDVDFDDQPRPQGAAWDLGPYER